MIVHDPRLTLKLFEAPTGVEFSIIVAHPDGRGVVQSKGRGADEQDALRKAFSAAAKMLRETRFSGSGA